jgi:uncharacterized membrane protein YedE/YeeE
LIIGGFLAGFGTRYANGSTSGHSIFGIKNFQLSSILATNAVFIVGFAMTYFILLITLYTNEKSILYNYGICFWLYFGKQSGCKMV